MLLENPQPGAQVACPFCQKPFAIGAERGVAGRKVGAYELIEKVGSGRMGAVFKARRAGDGQVVALKLLKTTLAQSPTFVQRFQREIQASAALDHPNLVKAFDFGMADGYYYFAMEFIDGETLAAMLARGQKLDEAQALGVAQAVAEAVRCAWEKKIVHRDIKPENLMAEKGGRVRLMDMGLAKEVDDPGATVTQAGGVLGSPAYAAPEQLRGETSVDVRADLYAMGTTLYHLVCGQQPFTGPTSGVVASKQLSEPLPDPRLLTPTLSASFCKFLERLTEKNPRDRYQTPEDVLQAIEHVRSPEAASELADKTRPKPKPPPRPGGMSKGMRQVLPISAAGVLIVIVALMYFFTRGSPSGKIPAGPVMGNPSETTTTKPRAAAKATGKGPGSTTPSGTKAARPVERPGRAPEFLARLAQLPQVKGLMADELFRGKFDLPGDGRVVLEYGFEKAEEYRDWGYRGQKAGPLVCAGGGTGLHARFLEGDFKVECEAVLRKGAELGLTLHDPLAAAGATATLFGASAAGSFLRVRAGTGLEWKESEKQKGAAVGERLPLVLERQKDKVVGSCGTVRLEMALPASGPVALRVHAGPESEAEFSPVRVEGKLDPAWVNADLSRLEDRQWLLHALELERPGENFALALRPGTVVELPKGFGENREWAVEMFIQVVCAGEGRNPLPPLFVCGTPGGASDVLDIEPQSMRPRLHFGLTRPAVPDVLGFAPIQLGEWYHLAVSSDGATVRLFLNGVLDSEFPLPAAETPLAAAAWTGIGSAQALAEGSEIRVDDLRCSRTVRYKNISFKPRPQSMRADEATWLLLRLDEKAGDLLKNGGGQMKADGKVTGGHWVSMEEAIAHRQ